MPLPRRLVLLLVVVALPALAGCNAKNWYNQEGIVSIQLAPQGPRDTSLDEFSRIRVAIFGVTVRQVDSATPKVFSYGNDPLLVDLVEKGKAGERIPLAKFKTNMRATGEVIVRMDVVEAVDAAGNSMQVCRLKDEPEKFPCFFVPDNSAYSYTDKPFAPPRGGEVEVGFPIGVTFAQQGRVSEYYLEADPAKIVLENHR